MWKSEQLYSHWLINSLLRLLFLNENYENKPNEVTAQLSSKWEIIFGLLSILFINYQSFLIKLKLSSSAQFWDLP